ncbi:ComF family protein [Oceanomicrobium pacificus]|uniref:ComF family protein n=1 Tax=Oceanomicrobium pacificus TaxID=2692916 RepID=A0A6B0U0W3_9RHOB|nr:ComF family protein [Oceanomicrobium pacificus]MXU64761.1 ComF family protein [Oceanomicrobium pacificus]
MLHTFAGPARLGLNLIFPPRCMACTAPVGGPGGLCPSCWRDLTLLSGPTCDRCAVPVLADARAPGDAPLLCDSCTTAPPAWDHARAVLLYGGTGRALVLALKHADRLDIAPVLARWMARAAPDLLSQTDLILPVPLHWRRRLGRRANQSAELARHLSRATGCPWSPDLLRRCRSTPSLQGQDRAERQRTVEGAFVIRERQAGRIAGRTLLLIDDVMTSGATLAACTRVLKGAGAAGVSVLVAARVERPV